MITRGQVAKRLGKSIATVRRMEGRDLHPTPDQSGTLRFDPDEVERAARERGGARSVNSRRSPWLNSALETPPVSGEVRLAEETSEFHDEDYEERARAVLAREQKERERAQREADEQLKAAERRVATLREEAEALELAVAQQELAHLLDSCSEREIRRLMRDPEFAALIDTLCDAD